MRAGRRAPRGAGPQFGGPAKPGPPALERRRGRPGQLSTGALPALPTVKIRTREDLGGQIFKLERPLSLSSLPAPRLSSLPPGSRGTDEGGLANGSRARRRCRQAQEGGRETEGEGDF